MNPEGGSSGTSPHLSIELLERLLPAFLVDSENRERVSKELPLFPTKGFTLPETRNVAVGSNISLSSSHAGTSQNPSSDVDLTLRLGHPCQGTRRFPAMSSSNIFAPRHAVGMHGGTKTVHLQTKRAFPDHVSTELCLGRSPNISPLAALTKRRATESHFTANNYVNPSPPLFLRQHLFSKTAPTKPFQVMVGQRGLLDNGNAIQSSSSSHQRQRGLSAQAYIQERPQYQRRGSSLSLNDLTHGPPPIASGITMMPNHHRELRAEMLLNETEEEETEEISDHEGDVRLAQHEEKTEDPLDDEGKYIIEPLGRGWSPAQRAIDGINYVIRSQFRGVYHSYGMIPLADRQEWFLKFKEKCTWDARHEQHIRKKFDSHCAKHLANILTQVRITRKKPQWMKMEHWVELLAYWDTPSFKNISTTNTANRASGRMHAEGCKAFAEAAKDMAKKFGRDPYLDEFSLSTHKYKFTGNWADTRAPKTYEDFQRGLLQQQSQVGEASSSARQETRVDIWSKFAKGKSSGQIYGSADFAANVHTKATSLTPEYGAPPSSSKAPKGIDKAQQ